MGVESKEKSGQKDEEKRLKKMKENMKRYNHCLEGMRKSCKVLKNAKLQTHTMDIKKKKNHIIATPY